MQLSILVGWLCVMNLHQGHTQQDVRPAVGVAFERQSFNLRPLADAHAATFVLRIPTKPHIVNIKVVAGENTINKIDGMSNYPAVIRAMEQSNKLNDLMNTQWKELEMFLTAFRDNSVQRRGLFNFVGSLSNTLFGTATEKQVKGLQSQVDYAKAMLKNAAGERADLY